MVRSSIACIRQDPHYHATLFSYAGSPLTPRFCRTEISAPLLPFAECCYVILSYSLSKHIWCSLDQNFSRTSPLSRNDKLLGCWSDLVLKSDDLGCQVLVAGHQNGRESVETICWPWSCNTLPFVDEVWTVSDDLSDCFAEFDLACCKICNLLASFQLSNVCS